MNIDEKFKVIKELLAEGYDGSISEYIQQIEQQEQQQLQQQQQQQQSAPQVSMGTPALAGKMPTPPQSTATERNIIQPGQYKSGGLKINQSMSISGARQYAHGGTHFNFNKSKDYSAEAIQERKDNSPYKDLTLSEKLDLGLSTAGMAPGLGVIPDAINTVSNLGQGLYHTITGDSDQAKTDYTNAAWAAGAIIPAGVGQGVTALKLAKATKLAKADKVKSLYRVVDATGNVQAAKFGSTIPDVATTGRRTGYKSLQKNTPFDVLNTTTDQKWIAGKGPDDPTSLFNTYGGKNPYVVKISRGMGDETLDVINKRTNVLSDFFLHMY